MMDAVFSVDVERDLHTNGFKGITEGIPILIKMLDKYSIKATFFATGELLKKYPSLFKNLARKGHEIGIHSYNHKRYDQMTFNEKEKDLKASIKVYKKIFKKSPEGFRAPQHSLDNQTVNLLEKNNFKYDSSKAPGNVMVIRHLFKKTDKKNIIKSLFSKPKPYQLKNNLFEIPRVSFIISTGGFELKLYPQFSYKLLMLLCKLLNTPFIFIMHSWDMTDIPDSVTTNLCSKKDFENKLDLFLKYSSKRLNYIKMGDLYRKIH